MSRGRSPRLLERQPSFQEQGLCAETDPEAFFPEKGTSARDAKAICERCDVQVECLEWALTHDEKYGVWGGKSERELKKLRKEKGSVTNS